MQRSRTATFNTLESDDVVADGAETFTYTNAGLFSTITQYFRVRTENHIGDSVYVADVSVTLIAPGKVGGLASTYDSVASIFTLSWDAPPGTQPFTYQARSRGVDGDSEPFFETTDAFFTVSRSILLANVASPGSNIVFWRVRATNTFGIGTFSPETVLTIPS